MDTTNDTTVYSREISGIGTIQLRPLHIQTDIKIIHDWVNRPYATYWGMQNTNLEYVQEQYQEIIDTPHHDTFIGTLDNIPIFLMERYKASKDTIANYYNALDGDYGMHILVGPPKERIPKFTWHVFSTIMAYLFSTTAVKRVVVEPDINNKKIHVLNKRAGFQYYKEIALPHKKAHLAFCTPEQFHNAFAKENLI